MPRHLSIFRKLSVSRKSQMTVGILGFLVGSFHRTPLPPRCTKPEHSCGLADIVSNAKEVLWLGLEPRSPAIAAVALPTELPLHNSGMRQITATHQPYDTIPNRPEGGIGWISAHLHLLDLLFYEEQNYRTNHSSLWQPKPQLSEARDPLPLLVEADYQSPQS